MAKSLRFAVGIITRLAPESIATRSLDVVTDLEPLDKVLPYYPTGKDFEEFLIQSINPVCLIIQEIPYDKASMPVKRINVFADG